MLLTQCSHCSAVFRVRTQQITRAEGRVRCGQCGEVFDALVNLREGLPGQEAPAQPEPAFSRRAFGAARSAATAADEYTFDLSDLPPLHDDEEPPEDEEDIGRELEDRGFSLRPAEKAAATERPRRWSPTLSWGIGCIVLTALLLAQGMVSREAVAGFAPLRNLAQKVCDIAGCQLSLPREPYRLALISRDVQPHPTVEDALVISATMVNRAPHAQAWPILEVTLADLNGRLVAMRRFGPDSYLNSDMDRAAGMPPDTPIHVVFETEDPGDDAVAFEFQFR